MDRNDSKGLVDNVNINMLRMGLMDKMDNVYVLDRMKDWSME